MADPDSPAEVPQRDQVPVGPPADSSEPGLDGCAPLAGKELREGGLGVQDGPGTDEVEEEGGADKALIKPTPPLLQLRRGTDERKVQCVSRLMLILNS